MLTWTDIREWMETIDESTAELQSLWVGLGVKLTKLRKKYNSEHEFVNARRDEVPTLSAQQASDAIWLASLPKDLRRELFERYPECTSARALRQSARQDGFIPGLGDGYQKASLEPSLPKMPDNNDLAAETQASEKSLQDKPDETSHRSTKQRPSKLRRRARSSRVADVLEDTFTNKHTRTALAEANEKVLAQLAEYIEQGKIPSNNDAAIRTVPSLRLWNPTLKPSLAKILNWKVFFEHVDREFERQHQLVPEPELDVRVPDVLNVIHPPSTDTVIFHGKQMWPRRVSSQGISFNKVCAVANFLEDTERFMTARGVPYTAMAHHLKQMCKWLREADQAFGNLVHEGACAWSKAPSEVKIPRRTNFAEERQS